MISMFSCTCEWLLITLGFTHAIKSDSFVQLMHSKQCPFVEDETESTIPTCYYRNKGIMNMVIMHTHLLL